MSTSIPPETIEIVADPTRFKLSDENMHILNYLVPSKIDGLKRELILHNKKKDEEINRELYNEIMIIEDMKQNIKKLAHVNHLSFYKEKIIQMIMIYVGHMDEDILSCKIRAHDSFIDREKDLLKDKIIDTINKFGKLAEEKLNVTVKKVQTIDILNYCNYDFFETVKELMNFLKEIQWLSFAIPIDISSEARYYDLMIINPCVKETKSYIIKYNNEYYGNFSFSSKAITKDYDTINNILTEKIKEFDFNNILLTFTLPKLDSFLISNKILIKFGPKPK